MLIDGSSRRIRYLRVSITDRCNFRCTYCMPEAGWAKVPRDDLATHEELLGIIELLVSVGVERVRFTGGEPLLRAGVTELVKKTAALEGVKEVVMTTNGHLLAGHAQALADAGLAGLSVSLDTLDEERFRLVTRGGSLSRVYEGLAAARVAGIGAVKINAVAIAGFNDDELADVTQYCFENDWIPRFIELMPIGALSWIEPERMLGAKAILERLLARFELQREVRPLPDATAPPEGPARYWVVTQGPFAGRRVGIISPMTDPGFCTACNRARLTARGGLRPCLANDAEVSILQMLRRRAPRDVLLRSIREAVLGKLPQHRLREPERLPTTGMTGIGG